MADGVPAGSPAPWRPDDIVAYEEMRDLAVRVQTLLTERARHGDTNAREEAVALRRDTLAVDGFERKAIDAHTRRVVLRLVELRTQEHHHE